MIIEPPNDLPLVITSDPVNRLFDEKLQSFLTAIPWVCKCGIKNHGWNEKCANFRCNLKRSEQ